ncbi:zinc finger matrin-type protein 5 [Agrilus planipennis]|uniref:Zinc finger matrin-type protein 5 n=1 Tax=Agrilus planipennis TaxID=224129 RepID=A0A1W4XLF7_AGRPL|nr:zinc finger matrin-type protein 5 [Agrilus planipennis]
MGRRYYCDYCNKTFIDDIDARKKHLSSIHHVKLRKLHYELHRDSKTVLIEESQKPPCRRFFQFGECQFSGSCKYSHYTHDQLWQLQEEIEKCENEKKLKEMSVEIPSIESWLEKYKKSSKCSKDSSEFVHTSWSYPEHLNARQDLPPSLKKFKAEDFLDDDFEEWGC